LTIAAHSDNPNRKLTKKEFDDLNQYLDEADKKFDDK
ncbi:DNA-binding protein, partial [Listeria monocytogenes]|nr:DNA-binding protein [Listeria monocytogenes]